MGWQKNGVGGIFAKIFKMGWLKEEWELEKLNIAIKWGGMGKK